jgi:hypothetical protein|tara:strand:- start:229 stop:624 length:396 start_codon:yes stop_codon:yes gene_type:complete
MITQKDWNVFFQQIDDRATESLLDIAHRKEDRNTAVMVDGLLKDSNFMHFFKDIMITEQLTEELPIKEIVISEFLMELLYYGIKQSEDDIVKETFMDLKKQDKEFLFLLMKKVLLSYGIKKYYENKYKLCV